MPCSAPCGDVQTTKSATTAKHFGGGVVGTCSSHRCSAPSSRGGKLREILVLAGVQDCGKSALLESMLWPGLDAEYFVSGLDLSADDKVLTEAVIGAVIVEAAEMVGAVPCRPGAHEGIHHQAERWSPSARLSA